MEKEGKVGSRCGRESVLGWWFEVLSFLSIRRNDYLPRVLEAENEPKFSTPFFPVGERRTASKSFFQASDKPRLRRRNLEKFEK